MLSKSYNNAESHLEVGWSYAKASEHAYAFSQLPNDAEQVAFNLQARQVQSGEIPPLTAVVGNSFGANHVNVFVRCVKAEVKCDNKNIAPTGRLDRVKLCAKSDGLAKAVDIGLDWTFLHGQLAKRWPMIPVIGQKALNYRGHSEITEIEGLVTMGETAERNSKLVTGKHDTQKLWQDAVKESVAAKPFWLQWAFDMGEFAKSVGADQIKEAAKIIEVCARTPPESSDSFGHCGSAFFAALRKLVWKGQLIQFQRVKMACIIAQLGLCPFTAVKENLASLIRASDLSKLMQKQMLPLVEAAECMMEGARVMVAHMPDTDRYWALGWHDARVLCHLIGRSETLEEKSYNNLQAVGQVLVDELNNRDGHEPLTNPWKILDCEKEREKKPAADKKNKPRKSADTVSNPFEMAVEGIAEKKSMVHQLGKQGFVNGANVRKRKQKDAEIDDTAVYKILRVDSDGVVIQPGHGSVAAQSCIPLVDVKKLLSVTSSKVQSKVNFETCSPKDHHGWALDYATAHVTVGLRDLFFASDVGKTSSITIMQNPKSVIAQIKFAKHALTLVPGTQHVSVFKKAKDGTDTPRYSVASCDKVIELRPHESLAPPTDDVHTGFVAAFWSVQRAETEEEANMELINKSMKVGAQTLAIPMMRNTKVVPIGAALLLPPEEEEE